MQQTTCGEIPKKVKLVNRKAVDDFLLEDTDLFSNLVESQNCMYSNGKVVSDQALNYLNTFQNSKSKEQLKLLLKKEFVECESLYPYLGDYFINKFFVDESLDNDEKFLLTKNTSNEFVDNLNNKTVKKIARWFFDNCNLQYNISVQKSILKEINVEKIDDLNFNLEYDTSFLGNAKSHTMKDYKFIIIDGQIDSVGEVHHLLNEAYNTKVPHVIFCFGLNPEVDHVIKYNNTHGKFEVFPVVIQFNEKTLNVLNDIAVLHKDNIVSSKTGQTISQAIREDLKLGKEITFHEKGFKIKPVANEIDLAVHKRFLEKRILEASHEESKKLLLERVKNFSTKVVKIYLPIAIYDDNDFLREIDYFLRFLKNSKSVFTIKNFNNKRYFLAKGLDTLVDKKVLSLKSVYSNIDKMVIYARN